jgi:predicted transcriptional regulator
MLYDAAVFENKKGYTPLWPELKKQDVQNFTKTECCNVALTNQFTQKRKLEKETQLTEETMCNVPQALERILLTVFPTPPLFIYQVPRLLRGS